MTVLHETDTERNPTLAAVVLPGERTRVEAAGSGWFKVLHSDTIPEAIRVVRERAVDAVLVSVHRCDREELSAIEHLVRDFPGVTTVAMVSKQDAESNARLLQLGATGVRQVVDVSSPSGWQRLRQLIGHPATRDAARILGPVMDELAMAPPDARLLFQVMIRLAPDTPTIRQLVSHLPVQPTTLISRFQRAGLPSPKRYLVSVRLLYVALLLERPGLSIADVVCRMEYSSPQSFGRHVRSCLGVTGSEFRRRLPFALALSRFIDVMITPYRDVLNVFHPLAAGTWDSGHCRRKGLPVRGDLEKNSR
jgi:AraC-like DNA-binding protein